MKIKEITLRNFRNYRELRLELNSHLNIFVGNNAQGKTNILEAIYLLATTKSFRATKEIEMVKHDESRALISGNVEREATHTLEIILNTFAPKIVKYNTTEVTPKDFIGNFNVVLFTPEDLYLIKGSPSERRRFLDQEISQVDAVYRNLLSDFQKVLHHRNSLLKEISKNYGDQSLLEIWDQQLVDLGSKLMVKRANMIYKLGLLSRLMHRQLSNGNEELVLEYSPFFSQKIIGGDYSYSNIKKMFEYDLNKHKSQELKRGYSLVGPQRDDFRFLINNLDAKIYGSQGQQRTAVLACRLGELEYMKSETGTYPVILLDDVMSELDESRKHFLMNLLRYKVQTIITTTTISDFTPELLGNSSILTVEKGKVFERC